MVELVAVLDTTKRLITNDLGVATLTQDSTVAGLRIDNGPTLERRGYAARGKLRERSWQMPTALAFSIRAFFDVVYHRGDVPSDRIFDCHVFAAYVLGISQNITRTPDEGPAPYELKPEVTPTIITQPLVGYELVRTKGKLAPGVPDGFHVQGVHSFIALPRRYGVVPESMGVTGVGGSLVVARTSTYPTIYSGHEFHRILGPAPKSTDTLAT